MKNNKWTRWENTRSKGQKRFLWVNGVLGWGVPTGILWAIFMTSFVYGWGRFWVTLPLALIGFPVGGYFWGKMMWASMETAYNKANTTPNDVG